MNNKDNELKMLASSSGEMLERAVLRKERLRRAKDTAEKLLTSLNPFKLMDRISSSAERKLENYREKTLEKFQKEVSDINDEDIQKLNQYASENIEKFDKINLWISRYMDLVVCAMGGMTGILCIWEVYAMTAVTLYLAVFIASPFVAFRLRKKAIKWHVIQEVTAPVSKNQSGYRPSYDPYDDDWYEELEVDDGWL